MIPSLAGANSQNSKTSTPPQWISDIEGNPTLSGHPMNFFFSQPQSQLYSLFPTPQGSPSAEMKSSQMPLAHGSDYSNYWPQHTSHHPYGRVGARRGLNLTMHVSAPSQQFANATPLQVNSFMQPTLQHYQEQYLRKLLINSVLMQQQQRIDPHGQLALIGTLLNSINQESTYPAEGDPHVLDKPYNHHVDAVERAIAAKHTNLSANESLAVALLATNLATNTN